MQLQVYPTRLTSKCFPSFRINTKRSDSIVSSISKGSPPAPFRFQNLQVLLLVLNSFCKLLKLDSPKIIKLFFTIKEGVEPSEIHGREPMKPENNHSMYLEANPAAESTAGFLSHIKQIISFKSSVLE